MTDSLKIYYQNVQSIRGRINTFTSNIEIMSEQYDALVITETWLQEEISSGELDLSRYKVYR